MQVYSEFIKSASVMLYTLLCYFFESLFCVKLKLFSKALLFFFFEFFYFSFFLALQSLTSIVEIYIALLHNDYSSLKE